MADSSTAIGQALELFESRQIESNRAYLSGHPFTKWTINGPRWSDSSPILNLRGTVAPTDPESRRIFCELLTKAVNDLYRKSTPLVDVLALPTDYTDLLELADRVWDPDLRGADMPGLDGVCGRITAEQIVEVVPQELDELPGQGMLYSRGWDVQTGFVLGRSTLNPLASWCGYYYTKKMRREIEAGQDAWAWRVFYKDMNYKQGLYTYGPMAFVGLVSWLDWYGAWWERVSKTEKDWYEERVRTTRLIYRSDEESDSHPSDEEPDQNPSGEEPNQHPTDKESH